MNTNKVFIFDFDGTFYSGEKAFSKLPAFVNKHKRSFLSSLTDEQYEKIVNENPEWNKTYMGSDLVDLIYDLKEKYPEFNITARDFWNWQNENPDPLVIDKNEVVSSEFMESLCNKYPVYVVSNSSPNHLYLYMKKIGINPEWFKEIISNKFTVHDRTKKHYYKRILEKENCNPKNVFVFGDSQKSDLNPAIELGMNATLVINSPDIPDLVKKAAKISF